MSRWTHVIGAICVDTYGKNAINDITEFLQNCPQITGSEREADMFLNQPTGHNSSCSEWDEEKQNMVLKEWETRVVISIIGDLRDRGLEQTQREVNAFITALENQFDIDYKSIEIFV